jgi:hypothetical protein
MVYIIKDLKKKKINQQFIDDVGERVKSYKEIIEESRKQKEEFFRLMKEAGIEHQRSFQVKSPHDLEQVNKLIQDVSQQTSQDVKDILRNVPKLRAIDMQGKIKEV